MAVSRVTTTGALGTSDLAAAAQIVYDRAKGYAAWSRKISATLTLDVSGNVATIEAPVEPGYAAEFQVRHPLFAQPPKPTGRGWNHWYPPSERQTRFLRPAIDTSMDAAIRRYAQKIDRMARAAGFR